MILQRVRLDFRIHETERGIMMEISELTAAQLENAIRLILTNKKYEIIIELVQLHP